MPLVKKNISENLAGNFNSLATAQEAMSGAPSHPVSDCQSTQPPPTRHTREAPMTKDDYWRRREERDIQRDKDMAWSGLAQAALASIGLVQLNTGNTLDDYLKLVDQAVSRLLEMRNKHNG